MNASISKWANSPETKGLFAAQPVKSSVGIIVLDQVQEFSRLLKQAGPGKFYANCQWGIYQMFFDSKTPVDWVNFEDIDEYRTLYFAYPIQLDLSQAARLAEWVENGGTLICEGMPGYFGNNGIVRTIQPGGGLDKVFGASEKTVEFMPDLDESIAFSALDTDGIPGAYFRQSYESAGADVLGSYTDGEAAVLCHSYGRGRALLIGTYPSGGYMRAPTEAARLFLRNLLALTGSPPPVEASGDPGVQYRLCADGSDRYLWLVNHDAAEGNITLRMEDINGLGAVLWGDKNAVKHENDTISARVPGKDAIVLELL